MTTGKSTSLHSFQWLLLISSTSVIAFQASSSLALAQTPATSSESLNGPRATEQSVYSPRAADPAPVMSVRLVSDGSTGESAGSTRQVQTPLTTTTTVYQQQSQSRFIKFTLTAGKYWKFNIKTNSLQTSHVEKELRLHKNISAANYIIDDDGWFQYNHQQQQLFAWPSLSIKPATYYFVLLPSGLDYEDGENAISIEDVVANIVVELIRPRVEGKATARLDLDQLIDFRLSLDYLHRHPNYPLLLTQIVSVFELLSKATTNNLVTSVSQDTNFTTQSITSTSSRLLATTLAPASSTNFIAATLQQNRLSRSAGKFTEFLLIDSNATQDGEFFSLTWTTLPSLVNNTIVPISECRLSLINETISRLSSRSNVYPVSDDKFVISYALEGPLVNSQAIIPTERGNYALKLSLHSPCKNAKSVDELGVFSANGFPTQNFVGELSSTELSIRELSGPFNADPPAVVKTTWKPPPDVQPTPDPLLQLQTSIRRAPGFTAPTTATSEQDQREQRHQPKLQPETKTLTNFLDTSNGFIMNETMPLANAATEIAIADSSVIGETVQSTVASVINETKTNPVPVVSSSGQESSLNDDLIGILNEIAELMLSIAIPLAVIFGVILIVSILIAICNLCIKKRRSKQFEVGDRFKFRYGSERKGFLKKRSKPVILEVDQASLSMGGTPRRQPLLHGDRKTHKDKYLDPPNTSEISI